MKTQNLPRVTNTVHWGKRFIVHLRKMSAKYPSLNNQNLSVVSTSKSNAQWKEQIIQLETQIVITYTNAFPPENHCTLAHGISALSILPILSHKNRHVFQSRYNKIIFTVSSRTFLSKIGIFKLLIHGDGRWPWLLTGIVWCQNLNSCKGARRFTYVAFVPLVQIHFYYYENTLDLISFLKELKGCPDHTLKRSKWYIAVLTMVMDHLWPEKCTYEQAHTIQFYIQLQKVHKAPIAHL